MDQCLGQQNVLDLHADVQDNNSPPSSKELSIWMAQLESDMKGKDRTICELWGTVNELADAVAKRERCSWRHQAESEDQVMQHKEE